MKNLNSTRWPVVGEMPVSSTTQDQSHVDFEIRVSHYLAEEKKQHETDPHNLYLRGEWPVGSRSRLVRW